MTTVLNETAKANDATMADVSATNQAMMPLPGGGVDEICSGAVDDLPALKLIVEEGDWAIIYVSFGTTCAVQVQRGKSLQMRYGTLRHEFLVGKPYGSRISATAGYVYVLRPTPPLWTRTLPHRTQILYTPDCSLIVTLLDLRPGSVVLESGTGSGSLTHALAGTVAPSGRLFSFDLDAHRIDKARAELKNHGFGSIVAVAQRNVCEDGFGISNQADGVFLDLPHPWEVVESAKIAMKQGVCARFCSFSPCIEQVQRTAEALAKFGFLQIETVELVPRTYKVIETAIESLAPPIKPDDAAASSDGTEQGGGEAKRPRLDPVVTVVNEDGEEKRQKKKQKTAASSLLTHIPFPVQQPTHTGYLISATLI